MLIFSGPRTGCTSLPHAPLTVSPKHVFIHTHTFLHTLTLHSSLAPLTFSSTPTPFCTPTRPTHRWPQRHSPLRVQKAAPAPQQSINTSGSGLGEPNQSSISEGPNPTRRSHGHVKRREVRLRLTLWVYLWLAETSQQPISLTTWLKVTPHCNHCNHCLRLCFQV